MSVVARKKRFAQVYPQGWQTIRSLGENPTALRVYTFIAEHCDHLNALVCPVEVLAEELQVNERTVRRAVQLALAFEHVGEAGLEEPILALARQGARVEGAVALVAAAGRHRPDCPCTGNSLQAANRWPLRRVRRLAGRFPSRPALPRPLSGLPGGSWQTA